jgi:hypothetical protein
MTPLKTFINLLLETNIPIQIELDPIHYLDTLQC